MLQYPICCIAGVETPALSSSCPQSSLGCPATAILAQLTRDGSCWDGSSTSLLSLACDEAPGAWEPGGVSLSDDSNMWIILQAGGRGGHQAYHNN